MKNQTIKSAKLNQKKKSHIEILGNLFQTVWKKDEKG